MTTRLLVSVRSVSEALAAADAGADYIDCKEPAEGALGGLSIAVIGDIVAALRGHTSPRRAVSATIGDWPSDAIGPILAHSRAVADCGVDWVKVGISPDAGAPALLDALAASALPVIPVLVADGGLSDALVGAACRPAFAAVMIDTADKAAGSLFDLSSSAALQHFLAQARAAGLTAGLAGALRMHDLPRLLALAPDFAGFRSAVCAPGPRGRAGPLDAQRVRVLRGLLRQPVAQALHASDGSA